MSQDPDFQAAKPEKPLPLLYRSQAATLDDLERRNANEPSRSKESVYAGLGWLDRLLALWILLAIVIGILLGNYADGVETALQRGEFVQVSVPIGS